jgi:hypothetical protein
MKRDPNIKTLAKLFFTAAVICTIAAQNIHAQASEDNQSVEHAFGLLAQVKKANKFITTLDSLSSVDLPVGIASRDDKNAENYAILISKVTLEGGHTYLDAYMAFTIPGTQKKVAFAGKNIPFSFNGGIFGGAKLYLVSDFEVPLSKSISLTLIGGGQTSVTWGCHGFEEMDISAGVAFDPTVFVPENPDGTIKNGKLATSFRTTITNWDDLLVGVSLEPFQLKALKGVGFSVTNAVLDLSDFANPSGISFGPKQQEVYSIGGGMETWQGVYIQDVQVSLPPQFRKKGSEGQGADSAHAGRITFYAQNVLVDGLGFTGTLGVSNLMALDEGDMQGWDFSVEDFLIDIQANELVAGQFNGQIRCPQLGNCM